MLIGIHRGVNGEVFHPLRHLFRKYPSWESCFSVSWEEFIWASRDENRSHPLEPNAVFDSEEQVFEKWSWIKSDSNLYIVALYTIQKEHEPAQGGWRWHKWGDYLGDKDPQCEYLVDEGPEITQVTLVEVHEIDTDKPGARETAMKFMEESDRKEYE